MRISLLHGFNACDPGDVSEGVELFWGYHAQADPIERAIAASKDAVFRNALVMETLWLEVEHDDNVAGAGDVPAGTGRVGGAR